jgi:hypothetical protein
MGGPVYWVSGPPIFVGWKELNTGVRAGLSYRRRT